MSTTRSRKAAAAQVRGRKPVNQFDDAESFFRTAGGRWATAQLKPLMVAGQALSTSVLRTLDTLTPDAWKSFDSVLQQVALIRLVGVKRLIAAGCTTNIPNALGKLIHQYEKITFMDEAEVSLDGVSATPNDRQEFSLAGIPLPITHKDFFLNLRQLSASRSSGTPLDTTQVATAGRVVAEKAEKMLFQGGKTFGGLPIYGYTTFPQRLTDDFTDDKSWDDPTKTGEGYLDDVLDAVKQLSGQRQFGPFDIFVPTDAGVRIEASFNPASANTETIRQRLERISQINGIFVADQLQSGHVIYTQPTPDNAVWVQGEPLQTVQWDEGGGFTINFKAFQIAVPLFRADSGGRSGVFDQTGTS